MSDQSVKHWQHSQKAHNHGDLPHTIEQVFRFRQFFDHQGRCDWAPELDCYGRGHGRGLAVGGQALFKKVYRGVYHHSPRCRYPRVVELRQGSCHVQ